MNAKNKAHNELPTAKNEDVEFSGELADGDDRKAAQRAEAADARQEKNQR
ncbi:YfhD family protein [Paenibacillus sp. Pae15]